MGDDEIKTALAVIQNDIQYIKKFIDQADRKFATKLVEKIVYGMVGLIIITVATALVTGVVSAASLVINVI